MSSLAGARLAQAPLALSPVGAGGVLTVGGVMRVWMWSTCGPDEPSDFAEGSNVYDDPDDLCWERDGSGQWWPSGDPWTIPEDLFGQPMHWSTLLETRGPLRSKPRQSAPKPTSGDG